MKGDFIDLYEGMARPLDIAGVCPSCGKGRQAAGKPCNQCGHIVTSAPAPMEPLENFQDLDAEPLTKKAVEAQYGYCPNCGTTGTSGTMCATCNVHMETMQEM